MCCYRDNKNFDRFVRLTQSVVFCTLEQLQLIQQEHLIDSTKKSLNNIENEEKEEKVHIEESNESSETEKMKEKNWSQQDKEKLFHLLSKIFLLNFPLYIAMKHGGAINPLAPVKVHDFSIYIL